MADQVSSPPSTSVRIEDTGFSSEELTDMKARSRDFLISEKYFDCEFVVGEGDIKKCYKAHKVLLAVASPVFETMFFGALPEKGTVAIKDISPESFWNLLTFIYTKEADIKTVDEAINVCRAAHKYIIPDLMACCREYIIINVTSWTVWPVLQFAVDYNDNILKECALEVISANPKSCFGSSRFDCISFNALESVLDCENLNMDSELILFNAIQQWAKRECCCQGLPPSQENVRNVLKGAWKKIRYLTLTPEQFASSQGGDFDLLTPLEVNSVFLAMHGNEQSSRLDLINTNKSKRRKLGTEIPRDTHIFHLSLLAPHFYKCQGKTSIRESFVVDSDLCVDHLVFPTQMNASVSKDCEMLQWKRIDTCYNEIMKVTCSTSANVTNVIRTSCAWNGDYNLKLCSRHTSRVSCTCIRLVKGDKIDITIELYTPGWYPLTLISSLRFVTEGSSSACKTHCFLKSVG